jgi:hypothetical protein
MKPPKQLKKLLRIKLLKQDRKIRVYGALHPKPTEAGPRFTTFFKQFKIFSADEKTLFYNVLLNQNLVEKTHKQFQLKRRPFLPVPSNLIITRISDDNPEPNIQSAKVLGRRESQKDCQHEKRHQS